MPRIPLSTRSPYAELVENWKDCTRCDLSKRRRNVVLSRGVLPADVVFVGEAPGKVENLRGVPFVGPAGRLLDDLIERSGIGAYRLAFTNLIACIPFDEDRKKIGAPPDYAVEECTPRLSEFIRIASPRVIVAVGKEAASFLEPGYSFSVKIDRAIPRVEVVHPAFILRANPIAQGLLRQRVVINLANAVEDYLAPKE